MRAHELEHCLLAARQRGELRIVSFLTAGDPSEELSLEIVRALLRAGVAAIELCVPFPRSVTDGAAIRTRHEHALAHGIDLAATLQIAARAVRELGARIVLLADYAYTVRPLGLQPFLERAAASGAVATLLHGLPAELRGRYGEVSDELALGRITTCFAGSQESIRRSAYAQASGFVYVVSRWGRSGRPVALDADLLAQLVRLRSECERPMAVGFGIATPADVRALRDAGMDAAIVGSALARQIETHQDDPPALLAAIGRIFNDLTRAGVDTCAEPPTRDVAALTA